MPISTTVPVIQFGDFSLATARYPISRRHCMPCQEIASTSAIGLRLRLGHVLAQSDGAKHAAAMRQNRPAVGARTGVEYLAR
jgi:hypothetical protein